MCSKARGSKIVICTDGLSNVGLGSLDDLHTEDEKLKASQFYEQVGLYAKNQGITISVIRYFTIFIYIDSHTYLVSKEVIVL